MTYFALLKGCFQHKGWFQHKESSLFTFLLFLFKLKEKGYQIFNLGKCHVIKLLLKFDLRFVKMLISTDIIVSSCLLCFLLLKMRTRLVFKLGQYFYEDKCAFEPWWSQVWFLFHCLASLLQTKSRGLGLWLGLGITEGQNRCVIFPFYISETIKGWHQIKTAYFNGCKIVECGQKLHSLLHKSQYPVLFRILLSTSVPNLMFLSQNAR